MPTDGINQLKTIASVPGKKYFGPASFFSTQKAKANQLLLKHLAGNLTDQPVMYSTLNVKT